MAFDPSLDYELVLPEKIWDELNAHLFRGDLDEHGAVIAAGVARAGSTVRLLARNVFLARDGVEYVQGQRGYRMLTAEFVRDCALFCRDESLAYLAVHNHGGRDAVAFSSDDLRSHERGYPALRDVTRGQIVGGIVFAENAVAGDLWLAKGRAPLTRARIVGGSVTDLYPSLPLAPDAAGPAYDRQARLFGDRGQAILTKLRVGVIGLGGIGSLVAEYLTHLGVGHLVLVDHDRLDVTNLSRVVGSVPQDAVQAHHKVDIAEREGKRTRPTLEVTRYATSVVDDAVARALAECDYLFLAADSMQARLVFNAIVHQFLVPGVQLGAKVPVDRETGEVGRVYSVVRPVLPGQICLWCNGLIPAEKLQEEALTPEERRAQRYVDEEEIPAPSVITLNAVAASHGVNDFLFRVMGLRTRGAVEDFAYFEPRTGTVRYDRPRADASCSECSASPMSRFARGDALPLPTRPRSLPGLGGSQ
jgi:hypothetical protein